MAGCLRHPRGTSVTYPYVTAARTDCRQQILDRYDALRATGSLVAYCEHVILVEFGLHPVELHALLSEDATASEGGTTSP